MFRIIDGKGFHITFENGVTVSVQFGWGNYCRNYPHNIEFEKTGKILYSNKDGGYLTELNAQMGMEGSPNAEIAIFKENGDWLTEKFKKGGDSVIGYCTPKEVLEALNWAAKYK